MTQAKRYIVGVDGSDCGQRALEAAIALAKETNASLELAFIIDWSGYTPLSVEEAMSRPVAKKEEEKVARETVLLPLQAQCQQQGIDTDIYHTWGRPASVLRDRAKSIGADMVIVGRRGHSNLKELLLGSVSNRIAHISDVPVLLIP